MKWAVAILAAGLIGSPMPLSPSPTNPLCYNSQAYRNTHEQECLISRPGTRRSGGGGQAGGGTIRDILHDLTGGILG